MLMKRFNICAWTLLVCLAPLISNAWIVTHPMVQLKTDGRTRFFDKYGNPISIQDTHPGCEIVSVRFSNDTSSPLPSTDPLWLVVLTDKAQSNTAIDEGCVFHPKGACLDGLGRTNLRYIDIVNVGENETLVGSGHGTTFCVPRGWCGINCNSCDETQFPRRNVNWPAELAGGGANDGFCQTWVEGSVTLGTTPLNPTNTAGDCYYSHETVYFNYKPTNCRVEKVSVYKGANNVPAEEYIVAIEGDDNDFNSSIGNLTAWVRYAHINASTWQQSFEETRVEQKCGAYHVIGALTADHSAEIRPGVSNRCAGHTAEYASCSSKLFEDNSGDPYENQCDLHACYKVGNHSCRYGNIILSTTFPAIAATTSLADNVLGNDFITVVVKIVASGPSSNVEDFNNPPNVCCDVSNVHHPYIIPPTMSPTSPTMSPTAGPTSPTLAPTAVPTLPPSHYTRVRLDTCDVVVEPEFCAQFVNNYDCKTYTGLKIGFQSGTNVCNQQQFGLQTASITLVYDRTCLIDAASKLCRIDVHVLGEFLHPNNETQVRPGVVSLSGSTWQFIADGCCENRCGITGGLYYLKHWLCYSDPPFNIYQYCDDHYIVDISKIDRVPNMACLEMHKQSTSTTAGGAVAQTSTVAVVGTASAMQAYTVMVFVVARFVHGLIRSH